MIDAPETQPTPAFGAPGVIRVVDVETTGIDADARVCEIGFCDVRSHGTDLAGCPAKWEVVGGLGELVDPGVTIPPETSAVHHIIRSDVRGALSWDAAARHIVSLGGPVVALAAHSAKFERQFLTEEITGGLPWICIYKCALRLFADAPSHSNQGLRYFLMPVGLDRGIAATAHRAFPDAYVSAFLLRDMLRLAAAEQLIEWSSQPALQVSCHIGSWRGRLWREVDDGFLEWVAARDFDEDVLFTVRTELERREAEREKERREAEASRAAAAATLARPFSGTIQ